MKAFALRLWHIWVVALVSAIVLAVIAGFLSWWVLQPADGSTTATRAFIIPKGQPIKVIGERLEKDGLIRQKLVFPLVVRWLKLDNKLQAGTFQISPSWSVSRIAQALTQGTNDVWITLPEGWRREEVAEYLSKQDLPEFDKAAFLTATAGVEGQLFPDTYLVPKQATAESIAALLQRTFDQKITRGLDTDFESTSLSPKEVVVLASLVEREAGEGDQMRQVAGILLNRLEIGMPLQVDATLQYTKGYNAQEQSWWSTPLAADKQLQSPFNTYLNPGLPPAPIANPGLSAITAVLRPMKSDNLFYIHDLQGQLHVAKTLDGHNANVQKYLR